MAGLSSMFTMDQTETERHPCVISTPTRSPSVHESLAPTSMYMCGKIDLILDPCFSQPHFSTMVTSAVLSRCSATGLPLLFVQAARLHRKLLTQTLDTGLRSKVKTRAA